MKWKSKFLLYFTGDFTTNSLNALINAVDGNTSEVYKRITFTRYITEDKGEEVWQNPYILHSHSGLSVRGRPPDKTLLLYVVNKKLILFPAAENMILFKD